MSIRSQCLAICAGATLCASALASTTVVAHHGAADPASEGWTLNPAAPAASTDRGPLAPDGSTGCDAWFVKDFGTLDGWD